VPLEGFSRALAPCAFRVVPPRLDFGAVDLNRSTTLAYKLINEGQDACYFSNLGLTANTDAAFGIVGANPGFMLDAGYVYDVKVAFAPTRTGPHTGTLELYVSDFDDPYRTYPISGVGVTGCLSVQPRDLDFGAVFVSCPPRTLSSVVSNDCPADVSLRSLVRGPGTSSEFSLLGLPAFPTTLSPGQRLVVDVRYAPVDEGLDSMPIFLDDGANSHLIAALGYGVVDPWRTDSFAQSLREKVDVLFVLDNSGSMADKQAAVGANLASFLRRALAQGVDYQLAVTTTGIEPSTGGWTNCPGGAEGGEAGRLYPVNSASPRILTAQTPNAEAVWTKMTDVGICHWLEQGFEGAYRALSPPLVDNADDPRTLAVGDGNLGFLRADARLALVYLSDEDDQSPGTVDFYLNHLRQVKRDPGALSVSVVVTPQDLSACPAGTSPGTRYIELATKAGGSVESICTPDWAASLERLGNDAFGAQSVFLLTARPSDAAQITVRVNGQSVAAPGRWRYESTTNSVIFEKSAVPGPGSHIEITYPLGCAP
jgi:hypothetical protein